MTIKSFINAKQFAILAAIFTLTTNLAFADGHGDKNSPEAKDEQNQSFNLSEMTCWDVMTLDEAERGTVLFLYYGYVSGTKGELVHSGQSIASTLAALGEHCSENPDDELLALMMKGGK